MAHTIRVMVDRPAEHCFERFCDVLRLPEWVPSISGVRALRRDDDGLALEVEFEGAAADGTLRRYTLLYAYDVLRRRVAWMPGEGSSQAVRGVASFNDKGTRCEMTYALELGPARTASNEAVISEARAVIDAFKRWVER